jgi:tight adherence protein B
MREPEGLHMRDMDATALLAILGLLIVAAGFAIARHFGATAVSKEVLRRMARPQAAGGDDIMKQNRRTRPARQLLAVLYRTNVLMRLEEMMWQAGVYAPLADILLIMLFLFGAGLAVGEASSATPLISFTIGGALASLPVIYIRFRRQRRLRAFVQQLPFALDLIRSSLEAGHSLLRGFQVVVAEFGEPIGAEFRSVIEQSRLGLPLPRALEEMLKRVPEEDLRLLVVAVKVQSEVGSSLAQIIGRLSEIVRTRQRLQAQIRALTAQSRMSGFVVGLLPVVMLGAFSVIQPSYTQTLFVDPTGVKILKVAAVLDVLGFLTIRRLLKVKF